MTPKTSGAEGKGKPLHYSPKKVIMKKGINKITKWPCDPLSNRRHTVSGADGEKLVTGHAGVGTQAPDGKIITGIPAKMRHTQKIGTWNVRGLLQAGKLKILENELSRCNINICGISETHWKDSDHFLTETNVVYFSGNHDNSRNGVAMIVPKSSRHCVLGYEPVSDRVMSIKLKASPVNLNIIQVYAQTSAACNEDTESFYSDLETTISKIPQREFLVVMGDFNSKIGSDSHLLSSCVGKYGLGQRNERGERLVQFAADNNLVISNSFFQNHPRRLYTWISPDGNYRNQIDYVLVRSRWKTCIRNTHTLPGADCGSDHQLLMAKIQLRLRAARKLDQQRRIEVKDNVQFMAALKQNWDKWVVDSNTECPDKLWHSAKNLLSYAVKQSTPPVSARKRQHWMSDNTLALVEERREMKTVGTDVRTLNEKSAQIQAACRRDLNTQLQNICAEVEAHAHKHESRDLHQKIRSITRSLSTKTWAIEDTDGQVVTEIADISETWRKYCQSLFEDPDSQCFASLEPLDKEKEPNILRDEIRAAITHLKDRKATGSDSIPIETKASGKYGVRIFYALCNKVWQSGKWPQEWAHTVFVPLHKKGSTKVCSNYRLIALIPHASKILLHVLNERLKSYLSKEIAREQAGFVKGKGTREQILIVRQIIEKSREYNKAIYICFVDFSKAFDSVKWPKLWKTLLEMGTPKHLVHLLRCLYEDGTASVKADGTLSNPFHPSAGVRQGCIISPLLFNIYTEIIMRRTLETWKDGIKMEDVSLEFGLKINRSKTKVMIVDRMNNNLPEVSKIANCEVVQSYVYLGALVSNNGGCIDEIKRRMAISRSAMDKLQKIWRNRNITKATKIRLVKALVFPIFLYASETWTLRESEKKKIDVLEMWCWRRIRDNDSIGRLVVQGRIEGTRSRGRSPMRWADQIKAAVAVPLHECARKAAAREEWRRIVKRATTLK
ncbi:jg13268 [Pararge aegeria aegeria]|uniref:Jg13268 protein n=1 Tax=Pararge aegeria aegeria TaxID=348720 RepID=A0A8S4RIA7_9NEOP|nr:jg13268 [Pararge aegeria aegeria]